MNYLEKLLQGAPVEWKQIGEVVHSLKTGLNPRKFFQLNTEDATNYYVTIRELKNGEIIFSDKTGRINDDALRLCNNRSNLEIGDVLFSGTGTIGETALIQLEPNNWNIKEGVYTLKPNQNYIIPKFLMYILRKESIKDKIKEKSAGGTVKSIPMKELSKIKIPIPPLSVQKEIVRILDTFTVITSELTSELTLRQKQYQHYRDKLLTFGDEVEWKPLGEVANFSQGIQVGVSDQFFEPREDLIRFLRIVDFVKLDEPPRYIKKPDNKHIKKYGDLIMIRYGASSAGKVFFNNSGAIANNMFKINIEHKALTNKFLFYYLSQPSIYSYLNNSSGKSTMPAITFNQVGSIKIPIPSIIDQQRIVSILDKFEILTNSLSEGLPKEIELRQKQYEYYREILLRFDKND